MSPNTRRPALPLLFALALSALVGLGCEESTIDGGIDGISDGSDATLDVAQDTVVDTTVAPDVAPDSNAPDTSDLPGGDCDTSDQTVCMATAGCVLDIGESGYTCRAARNACEHIKDTASCEGSAGCWYQAQECYCPQDVVCGCGGGPAGMCRADGDPVACVTYDATTHCGASNACCPPDDGTLGVCAPSCETCSTYLVDVTESGGMCMEGACRRRILVRSDGYVFIDDETSATPLDQTLDPMKVTAIAHALGTIDVAGLQDGYGTCCNSHVDGSDTYVTFFDANGAPSRTVRITDASAPTELTSLVLLVKALWTDVETSATASAAACQTITTLPSLEGDGPMCSTASSHTHWSWSLAGPRGQKLDRAEVILEAQPSATYPVTLNLSGVVSAVGSEYELGTFTLTEANGDAWALTVDARPDTTTPWLCLVDGQEVQVTAHVAQGGEARTQGLVIRDSRGVLFAAEDGLSSLSANAVLPFEVSVGSAGCPVSSGSCGDASTDTLAFTAGNEALSLFGGEWGLLPVTGEYDLAVQALRATRTGACDENPYAWAAFAVAGSDAAMCW